MPSKTKTLLSQPGVLPPGGGPTITGIPGMYTGAVTMRRTRTTQSRLDAGYAARRQRAMTSYQGR